VNPAIHSERIGLVTRYQNPLAYWITVLYQTLIMSRNLLAEMKRQLLSPSKVKGTGRVIKDSS
jgi:hypothetical protein